VLHAPAFDAVDAYTRDTVRFYYSTPPSVLYNPSRAPPLQNCIYRVTTKPPLVGALLAPAFDKADAYISYAARLYYKTRLQQST